MPAVSFLLVGLARRVTQRGRAASRLSRQRRINQHRLAFTLLELLIVVAVLGLLVSLLLPNLRHARLKARMTIAHSDLRQICLALDAYIMDNRDALPPMRRACGTNVNYQLPIELSAQGYLPRHESLVPQAEFCDVFDPRDPRNAQDPPRSYSYRAPGGVWQNGQYYDFPNPQDAWRPRAEIWIPEDYPRCRSPEGQFYYKRRGEPPCPVSYAVWSMGPDPESPKFPRIADTGVPDSSRFPLPQAFWMLDAGDSGLITHFRGVDGLAFTSP